MRKTFRVDPNVDKMLNAVESLTTPNALNPRQRMWYVNASDYAIIDIDIAPCNDLSTYVRVKFLFVPPSDSLADRVTRDLVKLADKYGVDLKVGLETFSDTDSDRVDAWYDKWGFAKPYPIAKF